MQRFCVQEFIINYGLLFQTHLEGSKSIGKLQSLIFLNKQIVCIRILQTRCNLTNPLYNTGHILQDNTYSDSKFGPTGNARLRP